MGPHEPYWRTNTSFSPRWDIRYHSEGQSFGSQEGNQMYESSTSSNSRETRSWLRGSYIPNHQHSVSDGVGLYISSPSDFSPAQQSTPSKIQEISFDDFGNLSARVLGSIPFSPTTEGVSFSAPQDRRLSLSSLSDNSEHEPIPKSQSSHKNFTTRRCFKSKPVHPLTFPLKGNGPGPRPICPEPRFSTASCEYDLTDVSEPIEPDPLTRQSVNQSYVYKCGLCERFLTQRSPWCSHRIVKTGDFPVTGVLPCWHVFHAECLDHITTQARKSDPLCPLCAKSDEEITSPEQQRVFSKVKNGVLKGKRVREEGPSRPWGCTRAGNCVEGALTAPSKNTMLLLNRNRVRKSLSLKSSSSYKKNGPIGSLGPSKDGSLKTASSSGKKS